MSSWDSCDSLLVVGFVDVLIKLVVFYVSGIRRLVIVEAGSKRVEGIISLSDVFRFLLG